MASGPRPASETAATTLTLAGNARHASRAVPSKTSVSSRIASRSIAATPGAPARPRGGFRVSIVTEARWPATAAPLSPSSPAIAADGAWMRPPLAAARATQFGVIEQPADRQDDQLAPGVEHRRRQLGERGLGRRLHDEVGRLDQRAAG